MTSIQWLAVPAVVAVLIAARTANQNEGTPVRDRAYPTATAVRLDGVAQKVGKGTTRTYVLVDQTTGAALEVGVALSDGALDGLPAPMQMSAADKASMEHMDMHTWTLELPEKNPTPFKFVTFGWNPQGHEPPGVWDVPHFDFHFYTVARAVIDSIVPSNPRFAEKAAKLPAQERRAQFYLDASTATKMPPTAMTVPQMGLHWFDVRTPEVQAMAGHPEAYRPFTKTYIYGSWDGQFTFGEPMITRAHLLDVRSRGADEVMEVPLVKFNEPGSYPGAYRITWDAESREWRIALTQFSVATK